MLNYQQEYTQKLYEKKVLGIKIHDWHNCNNFLSLLQSIIQNHKVIIADNDAQFKKSLYNWSQQQIKLRTWQHFNLKIKQRRLKIKRLLEQRTTSEYAHLKVLKKGL